MESIEESMKTKKHSKTWTAIGLSVVLCLVAAIVILATSTPLFNRAYIEIQKKLNDSVAFKNGVYSGNIERGIIEGTGSFSFKDGQTYSGNWADFDFEGYGSLSVPNEGTYEGNFIQSQKAGDGVFVWEDGRRYEGGFESDQINGKGTLTFPDGRTATGYFENGQLTEGSDIFTKGNSSFRIDYKNGAPVTASIENIDGITYNGEFTQNGINGNGILRYANGDTYIGNFRNGVRHGEGEYLFGNGDRYSGNWDDGSITGKGTYTFQNGRSLTGVFQNNHIDSGEFRFSRNDCDYCVIYDKGVPVSATIVFSDDTRYSGGFSMNGIDGYGQMDFYNGDSYIGEYASGKRNGKGKYTWVDSCVYEGYWADDSFNGNGKYVFEDGSYLSGDFSDNVFISGTYSITTPTGEYEFSIKNITDIYYLNCTLTSGLKYKGDYESGHASGSAEITYPTGDVYSGEVIDGSKNGYGVYVWKSGAKYDGYWSKDQMNGDGTYFYSTSSTPKLSGKFVNNKPSGECRYYVSSTLYYGTTWQNGKCVKVTEYAQ